jgi:hypothetical protein
MKHNKKGMNSMLKNNLAMKTQTHKLPKKFPVKNLNINKKTMSLANLVDSSDEGEDEEMQDDNESDHEAIENMEDDMDLKMIDMDLKRPSYQNYMGFVDEDQEDFE